ncbi:ribosome maturation factor RimM [Phormidium sp. CLA17]|uniref:ribosome maturation factor RimM n=1 Tax=Leptolyngbya sp. Cla-17 TaxID=2803751 RepID=UPI00149233B6|nr:ribosome maturation factor RimM [Leptolyngbya sp. Cla-17]MBM0742810.1 ribosome maturation factor RimM [Leptolyngbya sp. Cla-17]
MTDRFIEIGKIVSTQGLKGEVRVYPNTDFPERFLEPGKRWLLRPGGKDPQPTQLLRGRYLDGKGLYVVQLEGINTITDAEGLRDSKLMVPEGDRPALEEGEFHIPDLIGLEVFDQATQTLVGTVVSLIPAGNHLLEVQRPDPEASTVLIPFVMAIVPIVDLHRRRLEITPPAGLIPDESIDNLLIPSAEGEGEESTQSL